MHSATQMPSCGSPQRADEDTAAAARTWRREHHSRNLRARCGRGLTAVAGQLGRIVWGQSLEILDAKWTQTQNGLAITNR